MLDITAAAQRSYSSTRPFSLLVRYVACRQIRNVVRLVDAAMFFVLPRACQ